MAAMLSGVSGHLLLTAVALCFLSCLTQPQVGPLARVRWLNLSQPGSRDINVAMSYESTADELSFVFGAALIGIIAGIRPELGLITAAVFSVFFVSWFAVHRSAVAVRDFLKEGELNTPVPAEPAAQVPKT